MGANFNSRNYPDSKGKKEITAEWEAACEYSRYESGHSYSGDIGMLSGKIDWQDNMFATEREADDYAAENQNKWDPPIAVSYNHRDGTKWWLIGGWCSF